MNNTTDPLAPNCPACGSDSTGWSLEGVHPAYPPETIRCLDCGKISYIGTYIGDSISVREEDEYVVLSKEYSDGSEKEIRLDPAVLSGLVDWLVDTERIEIRAC